jgi:uncharacterized protein (TIRG00374 family)
MTKSLKSLVWVVLFLGVIIVVAWGVKNNPEWRSFSWREFLKHLMQVRPGYVLMGLAITLACYFIRALRWREFLFPIKRTSLRHLFSAVVIGFAAVSLLGRAGELSRPFVLSQKEKLPFSVSLTTVIVERLFDFSTILILFLLNLFFFRLSENVTPHSVTVFHLFSRAAAVALTVLLLITLTLFLFRKNALRWIDFLMDRVKLIPQRFKLRVEQFLKSFVDGLAFVAHPRPLFFSSFYSFLLWLMAVSANYFIVRGFGVSFTFSMAITMLTFSAMGAIVQLPGVGGGYQALTLYALVSFLGVSPTMASGITLVAWVIAFLPVVLIGLADLLHGGWSLRSLTTEAKKEVATALAETSPIEKV